MLETQDLWLKPYTEQQRGEFISLNCDPVVRAEMDGPHTPEHSDQFFSQLLQWAEIRPEHYWAIFEQKSEHYVGHLFIAEQEPGVFELGFIFKSEFWGKGFATQAVSTVLSNVKPPLLMKRLIATVNPDHKASQRVLEKCGFIFKSEENDHLGSYLLFEYPLRTPHG